MVQSTAMRSDPGRVINTSMDSLDTHCGYVCNGYTLCTRLQAFAKPHFFLVILILQGILQGASGTFFIKTLLSTKLGLSYTITRWMILGSETALLILAFPIIYWGSERRRPGWLAGSTFFFSVCCIIFACQVLSEHSVRSGNSYMYSKVSDLCQPWSQPYWFGTIKWNWITAIMIVVVHYAMGLNAIGYWAFGIGYIDDNTTNNMSPLFIGVALALKQFGPFIGLFISSVSVTTTLMGVYWLIVGGTGLLVAILTGMFPKKLTGPIVQQTGDPGLVPALTRIFTNKIIIFSWLAAMNLLTFVFNATALEEKYVESTFYITRASLYDTLFSIQYLFGILKPTVAASSMLISGIIIHRMKPRALFLCIWSIISICVAAGAYFAIIFLKCSATPIHTEQSRSGLEEFCNANCGCSEDLPFMPTCSQYYGFVYYSPCHAACTTSYVIGNTKVYSNCSCVPTGTVEVGHCSGGNCRIYWWLYEILVLIAITFFSSGIIGNLLICFRSILPSDKTIMIGVIFTVSTFVANVPHKILYDLVANWSCLYFVDSQCKIYDSDKLATFINLFNICLLLLGAGMLTVVCFMVQDLPLYNNQSVVKVNSESMTEMSDFRTQLNQALRTRRESAAEEQKLLSEPTNQTSHLRGHENGNRASFIEEDAKQKSSINGQRRLTLQKPLVPAKSPVIQEDKSTANSSLSSMSASPQVHSVDPLPTAPVNNQWRPSVPVKSAALVNEIKASLSSSSINSSPPSSPTHSSGTTVRNQGYLTTLL